jgi:hypothetical protein
MAGHSIAGPSVLVHQEEWYDPPQRNASVYGLVLDLTWYADVQGGYLMHQNATQFPVDITGMHRYGESLLSNTVPGDFSMDDIFVASLVSDVANANPAYQVYRDTLADQTMALEQPDMTVAGGYLPPAFGERFSLVVQRIGQRGFSAEDLMTASRNDVSTIQQVNNDTKNSKIEALKMAAGITPTFQVDAESYDQYAFVKEPFVQRWRREFFASNNQVILISASLHKILRNGSQVLFLVGSTRGSGSALVSFDDNSVNGFVAQIDANAGIIRRTKSIASVNGGLDRALGVCHRLNGGNVDSGDPFLYVVGMTDGHLSDTPGPLPGSFQAFIMKLSADTLEIVWTKQLAAATFNNQHIKTGSIHGMSCAVTPDGLNVFMAGLVKEGASVTVDGEKNITKSHGRDDIFVAQFEASNGAIKYVRQIGTSRDDHLAAGEGLVCDKYGNAILLGNTRGSFMNPEKEMDMASDIIILSVDRLSGEHYGFVDSVQTGPNTTADGTNNTHFPFQVENLDRTIVILTGVVTTVLALIAAAVVCFMRRRRQVRLERRIVKTYLQAASNDSSLNRGKFLDLEQPLKIDEVYLEDGQSETSSDMTSLLDPVLESHDETMSFSYQNKLNQLQMMQATPDRANIVSDILSGSEDESGVQIFEDDDVVDFETDSPLFALQNTASAIQMVDSHRDPLLGADDHL